MTNLSLADNYLSLSLSLAGTSHSLPLKLGSEEFQTKCLMSELENAIANGNHNRAAILAKELAIKRANCSLSSKPCESKQKHKQLARTSPIVYVSAPVHSHLI